MPSVTLYENGNARLSQPLISSYAIFGTGRYEIEGNELTVSHGNTTCTVERNASGEGFPLHLNGSTGYVFDEFLGLVSIPKYKAQKWLDYFRDENLPWDDSIDLTLPEFPGVTFTWTSEKVTGGDKDLFWGMPVWNVYLADLTNDGKPEFCATVSIGSGIIGETGILIIQRFQEVFHKVKM